MQEGIRLLESAGDPDPAILCFDRALELRRRLPAEVPIHAYGLAACWLNRAEALTRLGPGFDTLTLHAYGEALVLLRALPLGADARFSRRLAIALQNRALVLAAQNPPATADAVAGLNEAIAVLDHAETMDAPSRDYLLAAVWVNLANIERSETAARRAMAVVRFYEHDDAAAAEIGLKARHILCQIAAHRLADQPQNEPMMAHVHDATDLVDEGLDLAGEWEERGVERFRTLASDLRRFGARVYAQYQPQFLQEFLSEQSPERQERATPQF
ncbi:MAG TPA: hypothetical protein VHC90_11980 [Bryobacteraceae bacterium]|nr:hypothetical protein [Bryobacteraceae bacterium]